VTLALNAAFASDLSARVPKADFWLQRAHARSFD